MPTCTFCQAPVDADRASFLEDTGRAVTCLACTGERPRLVLMDYGHKTAGYAVPIPLNREAERLAIRAYKRAR
jgi:hypothetical protein